MTRRSTLMLAVVYALSSCASFGVFLGQSEGEVSYAADPDENLKRGEAAMAQKNHTDAAKYFEHVKTKYPFIEASKVAELRLADVDFDRERFVEARDRYQNFIRLHPNHPKVDYAAYRAALTHYKDIPSDFFILPPSTEKDQAEVKSALGAMNDFIKLYPDSSYVAEAQKTLNDVKRRLAEHELYVADFYLTRKRWLAVVGRLNVVAHDFSGLGFDERVSFGLYEAYMNLNDATHAREALERFVAGSPDSSAAEKARKLLKKTVASAEPLRPTTSTAVVADGGTP